MKKSFNSKWVAAHRLRSVGVQYHRDSLRCVYLPYIRSVNVARDAHELVDNGAGRRGVLCVLVFFGFLVFLLLLCPF